MKTRIRLMGPDEYGQERYRCERRGLFGWKALEWNDPWYVYIEHAMADIDRVLRVEHAKNTPVKDFIEYP